jgi:hypothetical protein
MFAHWYCINREIFTQISYLQTFVSREGQHIDGVLESLPLRTLLESAWPELALWDSATNPSRVTSYFGQREPHRAERGVRVVGLGTMMKTRCEIKPPLYQTFEVGTGRVLVCELFLHQPCRSWTKPVRCGQSVCVWERGQCD